MLTHRVHSNSSLPLRLLTIRSLNSTQLQTLSTESAFFPSLPSRTLTDSVPSSPTRGIQLSSVEILPSALPLDATDKFSSSVLPYIRQLLEPSSSSSSPEISAALERATLARDGRLEKQHEWLLDLIEKKEGMAGEKKQRAVVLGAG